MGIKDDIAAGPKFNDGTQDADMSGGAMFKGDIIGTCQACISLDFRDTDTGLCRPCWRAWRFGVHLGNEALAAWLREHP